MNLRQMGFGLICGFTVVGFWPGLLLPAIAQQDAGGTSTLQVFSRLTVVDVTAIDSSGQPVYGLKQSDFRILEDGKEQPIKNFEEIGVRPVVPPRELPPHVYTNLQPDTPSPAVNILLLDLANEAPKDSTNLGELSASTAMQQRAKQAAIEAIQNMPVGTRVAVLTMTNNLRIVQSFSADRNLEGNATSQQSLADVGARARRGGTQEPNQCVQENNRNRMVLESLDQIAVSTAAIKGRKNLIWYTVGIPAITDPNERPECLPDYSRGLSNTYDLLTAAQVSVYPVDAAGVDRLGARQLSEQMVAEATGGVAYSDTNDVATATLKAIDNGANYYSIAYSPPDEKYNGAYHKIDVKVDRPGVTLVFRKGYYADDLRKQKLPSGLTFSTTPPPAYGGNMKAPMSRGMALSQQILFDVGVEPSALPVSPGAPATLGTLNEKFKGKHLTRYSFQYVVPLQQIAFTSGANMTHKAALDFDIAVYDANDTLVTGLSQIVKTTLKEDTYQQQVGGRQPIRFTQQIDLPPGRFFVRVGVLDHTTNQVGTLELPMDVAKR
jgi:VWFA-related protein